MLEPQIWEPERLNVPKLVREPPLPLALQAVVERLPAAPAAEVRLLEQKRAGPEPLPVPNERRPQQSARVYLRLERERPARLARLLAPHLHPQVPPPLKRP